MCSNGSHLAITIVIFAFMVSCTTQTVMPDEVSTELGVDGVVASEDQNDLQQEIHILPPEPSKVVFQSLDGVELQGVYYPSGEINAPLVVLAHWAQGDQTDWMEIAYWLQNRGLSGKTEDFEGKLWLDSSWFPEMTLKHSFAVFTFDFRGCSGGCKSFDREKWLLDAQAAAAFAQSLEGVDGDQIAFVGASIGADGAADGCLYLNSLSQGACKGAFSLSPGNYLILDYPQVIEDLNSVSPAVPAWCIYSEDDAESFKVCDGINASNFKGIVYESGTVSGFPHGMNLIQPSINPNPLLLMLDFLDSVID